MRKLRTVIVDDEKPARDILLRLLGDDEAIEIVAECKDGREAIDFLTKHEVDIVFLDIRMPHDDGFAVLSKLDTRRAPAVVFVTAYDQYAIKAFEYNALDYLLKPFRRERFTAALERAKVTVRLRRQTSSPRWRSLLEHWLPEKMQAVPNGDSLLSPYVQRLFVRSGKRSATVDVAKIDWIKSLDHFVEIHSGGKVHIVYSSMAALEEKLNPSQFLRIHRTAIVNVSAIHDFHLESADVCFVVLRDDSKHRVSRSRRAALAKRLSAK